ncbi:MAG: HTTM domain-containing protein [Verrucomicrobiota bacterium]
MSSTLPQNKGSLFTRLKVGLISELYSPVSAASLAVFRIIFGALLVWEVYVFLFEGWAKAFFIDPQVHFKYYGFEWIRALPGDWMYAVFWTMGIAAVCITLGLFYKAACAVFAVGFAYVFLIDQATYLNHFYLVVLLSGIMFFLPANRIWSLDRVFFLSGTDRQIPKWSVNFLRLQIGIVYFFAGVAKLNRDWLAGEPMTTWMSREADLPVLGPFLGNPDFCLFLSYSGLFLDLLALPGLLWKRTRVYTAIALALFHLTNIFIFHIGIFPWLMLGTIGLFFSPDWPLRLLRRDPENGKTSETPYFRKNQIVVWSLAFYFSIQIFLPIRHVLYPGDVNWTEEGHRFAWRMKLRDKQVTASFRAVDPHSRDEIQIGPADYLNIYQWNKAKVRPDMLLQFAQMAARDLEDRGFGKREIYANVEVSLNFRTSKILIDPEVDLAEIERNLLPADWIIRH